MSDIVECRRILTVCIEEHPFDGVWFWWQRPKKMSDEDFELKKMKLACIEVLTLQQIQDLLGSKIKYANKYACNIIRQNRLSEFEYKNQDFKWYSDLDQLLFSKPEKKEDEA